MTKEEKREYDRRRYWANIERERARAKRSYRRARGQRIKEQDLARVAKRNYNAPELIAVQALNHAIRKGVVVRPKVCERCGKTHAKINGHHSDYSKPLEVIWVCPQCHADIHREARSK